MANKPRRRNDIDFPVSETWQRFYADAGGRTMPQLVRPEGSVAGTERVGELKLHRIKGAIDEGNLDALIENLETMGIHLGDEPTPEA